MNKFFNKFFNVPYVLLYIFKIECETKIVLDLKKTLTLLKHNSFSIFFLFLNQLKLFGVQTTLLYYPPQMKRANIIFFLKTKKLIFFFQKLSQTYPPVKREQAIQNYSLNNFTSFIKYAIIRE